MDNAKYYGQLLEACDEVGIKLLSDDYCCQLLAVVDVFGNEDMIFGGIFAEHIKTAQKRLNINGGLSPNGNLVSKMKDYIDELNEALQEAHEEIYNSNCEWGVISDYLPAWAKEIEKKYKTKFRR